MPRNFKGCADADRVAELLSDMVSIESINPHYPGATTGEDRLGDYVMRYMQDLGIKCQAEEVLPGRRNIIGLLEGNDERGLCFETHLDTVSVVNMTGPALNPVITEGRMYGRGSCDAKGSLAAMLTAVRLLVENRVRPSTNVFVCAVVDEEYRYRGVTDLLSKRFRVRGVVVGEPTELAVVTACKGVVRWKIHAHGKAGHSARPDEGHNAIYDMADLIQLIKEELIPSYRERVHGLLGNPTVSVGCISGGTAVNIIPDACVIEIDRRMLPGETWDSVSGEFKVLLERLSSRSPRVHLSMEEPYLIDEAMETDPSELVVVAAQESCRKVIGSCRVLGVSFCCDATKFHRANMPTIVLGPGSIIQAHGPEEFVEIEQVARAAEIYAQMCIEFN